MSLLASGIETRHNVADIAAQRQIARDHWSGHAEALHRTGLIDEELREMLTYADSAYGHASEE